MGSGNRDPNSSGTTQDQFLNLNNDPPLPNIPGVDMVKGIAMTGGTEAGYRAVLSMFRKDAENRLPLLQKTPEAGALPVFITQVHALKSASASIGAAEVSVLAAALEAVGKTGDLARIGTQLPAFAQQLAELVTNIRIAMEADTTTAHKEIPPPESPGNASSLFVSLLRNLEAALKSQNAGDIDHILDQLTEQPLDGSTKTAVEQLSDEVLIAEYGKAGETLEGLFSQITREK
jgi:HPt (histidine-containing phosphotransfer) domain-containing protein